jgi:hypothetical protein
MPLGYARPVIVRGFETLVIRVYVGRTRNGTRPNAERPNQTSWLGRFDPQFAREFSFESEGQAQGSRRKARDASGKGSP